MKVTQLYPSLCDPKDYTVHGILQARILEWIAFPFSRGSSQTGIEPRWPSLWADSLPAEPQGKPKNTGVGSPSLLQRLFLTQEPSWGLQHCRWILYQLSYEGSPNVTEGCVINSVSYCSSQLMLSIVPGQCGAGIATPFLMQGHPSGLKKKSEVPSRTRLVSDPGETQTQV